MKKVEFIEKVLLAVLKREIHRTDYVIGRRKLDYYPYQEVVTFSLKGTIKPSIMRLLSEHFCVCVVNGEVCLSGVRGQMYILAALGIKLT